MNSRILWSVFGVLSMLLAASVASAAGKNEPGATLDFEGDVIEGEKKGPDLMFQTENAQLQLDAVLYNRADFNDFHISDSKTRPRYSVTSQTPPVRSAAPGAPAQPGARPAQTPPGGRR